MMLIVSCRVSWWSSVLIASLHLVFPWYLSRASACPRFRGTWNLCIWTGRMRNERWGLLVRSVSPGGSCFQLRWARARCRGLDSGCQLASQKIRRVSWTFRRNVALPWSVSMSPLFRMTLTTVLKNVGGGGMLSVEGSGRLARVAGGWAWQVQDDTMGGS
jgi:hypothetical protein